MDFLSLGEDNISSVTGELFIPSITVFVGGAENISGVRRGAFVVATVIIALLVLITLFISLSLIFSPLAEISRKLDEFDNLGKKPIRMD